jgi:hypothetical protein
MPRVYHRHAFGPLGLLGVIATSLGLMGCPGSLDSSLLNNGTGAGGTSGGGGGASGGTGTCDVTAIFTQPVGYGCATSGCHDTASAPLSAAGLDLTLNATIGSRLVGVASPGNTTAGGAQACGGQTYLDPMSNPATGLLIDKITLPSNSPDLCGLAMPYPGTSRLSAAQQTCVEQWAEGLIMAAAAQ